MGHGASRNSSLQIQAKEEEEFEEFTSKRIVLVTGCSSGIGLAIAALLAKDPQNRFKVYASMRNLSKKEDLEKAAQDVLGDLLIVIELDVCSDDSVNEAVAEIIRKEGRIDVLVNNAGMGLFCVAECADLDKVKNLFDTNVFGVIRMTNIVVPYMKKQMSGHIVNIGSVYGLVGLPFGELYSATKFAVEGFTESFAPVLKKFNIRSTLIEPGPIATKFAVKAKTMREEIDISSADEQTKSLLNTCLQAYYHHFKNTNQTPEEIADVVKKVLLLKNPHLRYQTNENYKRPEIAVKLLDTTGEKIMALHDEVFSFSIKTDSNQ